MKRKVVMLTLCLFISVVTAVVSADEIKIEYQAAFSMRFPDNIQHLGFPKGLVLAVLANITPIGYPIIPITEVTAKNLDTGSILKLTSVEIEMQTPGLYSSVPLPPSIQVNTWGFGKLGSKMKREMKPLLKHTNWTK